MATKKENLIEVCRSYSYKMAIPNSYENRDFFCSRKEECFEDKATETSERLFEFCKDEVMKNVYSYKLDDLPKDQKDIEDKELATVHADIENEKE